MCFLLFDSDKEKYILYNKQELGKTSLVKCKSSEHKPGAAWPCGHRARLTQEITSGVYGIVLKER